MALNCPDCGERVMNLRTHVCKGTKSSRGGMESRHADNLKADTGGARIVRQSPVERNAATAGVAPGPRETNSRAASRAVERKSPLTSQQSDPERVAIGRTGSSSLPTGANSKRGRPRIGEQRDKPWLKAKPPMSERTWYRRRKEQEKCGIMAQTPPRLQLY